MKTRLKAWGDTKILAIASVVVVNDRGQVLLLKRHTENLGGGKWGTPGGRLEAGEDARTAAFRELQEETGITARSAHVLGRHEIRMPHGAVHMTSFKLTVPGTTPVVINPHEHHAYKWFEPDTLLEEADLLWGIPTILYDFGILDQLALDPTLKDEAHIRLLD